MNIVNLKKECYMKNQMTKRGTTTAAALAVLFVLTGCVYVLPYRAKLAVTITENTSGEIPDGGDIFFNVGGAAKTFSAAITGAEDDAIISFEWELVKGNGVVTLAGTGDTRTVTPTAAGDAKIKVKAGTNYDVSAEAEYNIYVNPLGYSNWTFKILDGSTQIYDKDNLQISPENIKNITMEPQTGVAFSFDPVYSGNVVTVSAISDNSFTITTGPQFGKAALSIKAVKESETITKTFTVVVQEPGVLFAWNNVTLPLSGSIVNRIIYPSGYSYNGEEIYFAANGTDVGVTSDGAFTMGGGTASTRRIVVGTGSDPAAHSETPNWYSPDTNTIGYAPGQFDLSQDKFRITVEYKNPVRAVDGNTGNEIGNMLRFYINSTRDSPTGATSILGITSEIRTYNSVADLKGGLTTTSAGLEADTAEYNETAQAGKISITFTPSIRYATNARVNTLKQAYFMLTSASQTLTITGIKLEKVE